jgi:hypothetical protein
VQLNELKHFLLDVLDLTLQYNVSVTIDVMYPEEYLLVIVEHDLSYINDNIDLFLDAFSHVLLKYETIKDKIQIISY